LPAIPLPRVESARSVIEHEWVTHLEDLVERRLMLLYNPDFNQQSLQMLAGELVTAGKLSAEQVPAAIDRCRCRLKAHFGFELPL